MTCPFKVGDRIHEVQIPGVVITGAAVYDGLYQSFDSSSCPLDSFKPDATIISLTPSGFAYRYDRPIFLGLTEGEVSEGWLHWWRKIA